ncbi:MAG: flagellar brake protein [Sulfuricella sp.]|nr:flagellar brake protein [Sulfuricella sp.]
MSLIALTQEDLELGVPVPWTVYDQFHNVLLPEGGVIGSLDQLLSLLAANPCRELTWEQGASAPPPPPVDIPFPAAPAVTPASTRIIPPAAPVAASEQRVEITPTGKPGSGQQETYPFEAMKLKVGDRLQLQPPQQLSAERYVVRLLGYLNNVSLLVTSPFENGLRLGLMEGEKVVVRIFAAQNAFGFTSTVEKICKLPFDYLHLSFPSEVQGMVIRKSPRVRARIIAAVGNTTQATTENASGLIANLSATGAMLDARRSLGNKGDLLRLAFRVNLHKIDAYLSINAAIRAIFADEAMDAKGAPLIHHGIEFVDLQPNDSVILQSMIYQQMIEEPHTLV